MSHVTLPFHSEAGAVLPASPSQVFEYLDDPRQLTGHMSRRSAMMFGSRLTIEVDQQSGRAVGSVVRMTGRVLGIPLSLAEVITEREPPWRKLWQTVDTPRLLVLTHYRMGYEVAANGSSSRMRVFLDYQRPRRGLPLLLGWLFSAWYARWCTRRMVGDAVRYFRRERGNR